MPESLSFDLVTRYHDALPMRIREYLNHRGILDAVIDLHLLGWDGQRITIPIFDRDGRLAFFKLAKDPDDPAPGPKMMTSPGASADLYGWERARAKPCRILICEGEFDRLVLESNGLAAVTSTGGAGVFRQEWADEFAPIPEVYVCFDRDEAGRKGALRVARMIPQTRIVDLPDEVGPGGDVTDWFVRLRHSREDFLRLMEVAQPAVPEEPAAEPIPKKPPRGQSSSDTDEIARVKSLVTLEDLAGRYVTLRASGQNLVGRCPFHEDRVPSLVIYPPSQTFHCFGCQAHGDVIAFLMRAEHLTFPETLRVLRKLSNQDGQTA